MKKIKIKYLIIGFIIVNLISIFIVGTNLFKSKPKENKEKTISQEETRSMLSYTLDGEKTNIKPTKESGYIANKIICENGSNLIWDNTNWEVEIISLESNDVCSVDFTTNESTNGYRVTATTNVEGSIDSLSKATIENGTIIFYSNKGQQITSVSGCSGVVENNKIIVNNITNNQTCNIEVKIPLKTLYVTLSDEVKYTIGIRDTAATSPIEGTSITQGYKVTSNGTNYTGGIIFKTGNNYYFAGNPSDNWVKFAGFWWRIIRTNLTEGTRLLYAGTKPDGQDGYINNTTYQWHSGGYNAYELEWSYANSTIGNALTNWYISNILSFENLVNTNVTYCSDISGTASGYGAYNRLTYANVNPSYECVLNGNSTHKSIGLMTADEVAFAGGHWNRYAVNTYFYRNSKETGCSGRYIDSCSVIGDGTWVTMSPWAFRNGEAGVFVVSTYDAGWLEQSNVSGWFKVRPVITLKPEVKVSGSGTTDDPFIPSL